MRDEFFVIYTILIITIKFFFQIMKRFESNYCIFVMVFHRILDFKTRLDFYPASYFLTPQPLKGN